MVAIHDNARTYQSIAKLQVINIKSVNMNQLYILEKELFNSHAIIDIHKFTRDKPTRDSTIF